MSLMAGLSAAAGQADPFHDHYHGGSWGRSGGFYRSGPAFGISIGGRGGGFSYYSAGSSFYGPGLSVYSGPSWGPGWGGPIIAPPVYVAPYGYGYGGYAPYGYGYGYGAVTSPYLYPEIPSTIDRAPPPSGAFSLPMLDQNQVGQTFGRDPLNVRPNVQTHPKLVKPSTPEAQIRALRLQDTGDQQLRAGRYNNAAQAYEKAIEAAEDIPDPYFRLAVAFIGKGRLVEAANTFEEAAALDPQLPSRFPKLDELLGLENRLAKEHLKEAVVQWANANVRDTQRLFLLGVVMYLDNDPRAREILESASKLGGATPGLQAFLNQPAPAGNVATPAPGTTTTPVLPRGNAGVPLPPAPNLGPAPGELPMAPKPSTVPPAARPPLGPTNPVPPADGSGVELPLPVAPKPNPSPSPTPASPSPPSVPTPAQPISGNLPTLPPLSP